MSRERVARLLGLALGIAAPLSGCDESAANPHSGRASRVAPPVANPALARALATPGADLHVQFAAGSKEDPAALSYPDPNNPGRTVRLAPRMLVTSADMRCAVLTSASGSASVDALLPDAGASGVLLLLSDPAAERLLQETTDSVGRAIGVVLNGELISFTTLGGPLAESVPLLAEAETPKARELAQRLNQANARAGGCQSAAERAAVPPALRPATAGAT